MTATTEAKDRPANFRPLKFAFDEAVASAKDEKLNKTKTMERCISYLTSALAPMGRNARRAIDMTSDKLPDYDPRLLKALVVLSPQYEKKSTRRIGFCTPSWTGKAKINRMQFMMRNVPDLDEVFTPEQVAAKSQWKMEAKVVDGQPCIVLIPLS